MKILVILNPCSGSLRKRHRQVSARIAAFASKRGWDLSLQLSQYRGHARALAAAALAEPWDRVVACGGDGTLNEVAGALVNSDVVFGLLPMGTGNGLARHLGIPLRLSKALAVLDEGVVEAIDTGLADGHPFVNVAGLGFDAAVGGAFNKLIRRGRLPYAMATLKTLFQYREQNCIIGDENPDATEVNAFLLTVANSSQFGLNARVAPGASVIDGKLDLVAARVTGPLSAAGLAWKMFFGTIQNSGKILHQRERQYTLTLRRAGLLHTDGEIHSCGREVLFAARPASLRIVVPHRRMGGPRI